MISSLKPTKNMLLLWELTRDSRLNMEEQQALKVCFDVLQQFVISCCNQKDLDKLVVRNNI